MYESSLILSKVYLCLVFSSFKKIWISLMPNLDSVHFQEHNDMLYVNTLQILNKWDGKRSISETSEIKYYSKSILWLILKGMRYLKFNNIRQHSIKN